MILSKDKKILIILFIMLLIVSSIAIFVVYPTISEIKNINKETDKIKNYLEIKHQNALGVKQSKEKSEAIKETVASYLNYVFYTGEELKLITTLENIASESKVIQNIKNYKLDNDKIILNITVNGEYNSILEYIKKIETANYFINIDNFTASLNANKEQTNLTTAEFTLSLYAQ